MARILIVRNWETFQHYKDRNPPWIKLYRDTFSSEAWVLGTDTSRLLQLASTLLAARYSNKIPLHFALLRKVASLDCDETSFMDAVAHLCAHQFLEIQDVEDAAALPASNTLATCAKPSGRLYSEERREETEERRVDTEGAHANASNTLATSNAERKGTGNAAQNAGSDVPHGTLTREFETWLQQTYPPSAGQRIWTTALHNIGLLIEQGRATEDSLRQVVTGYRAFVDSGGVSGPSFVRTPQTFFALFGEDLPWQRTWAAITKAAATENPEAVTAWERLIASDGAERPPRAQIALIAIGGWTRVRERTSKDTPFLRRDFIAAFTNTPGAP